MNIGFLLDIVSGLHPDRAAVVSEGRAITYAKLQAGARQRAELLRSGGRPLGYVGTNRPAFPLLLFTAAYAGVPFVPLNFRVTQAEYEHYLSVSGVAVVVAEQRYQDVLRAAAAARGLAVEVVGLRDLASAGGPGGTGGTGTEESTDAVRLFTSGTSSAAKLVRLSHGNLSSYVVETAPAGSAGPEEAALLAAPPYHVAAVVNALSSLFRGRRLVLMERFDAREWLELVAAEAVTHAMVVPTMLARILHVLEAEPALAPVSLRTLSYGGSRAPDGLVERALTLLPETVGLINAFGLTETSSTVAMLGPEDHRSAWESDDEEVHARLRSVGRPVPGLEVRVLREDSSPADAEEVGEVCVRGPQVSAGYVAGRSRVDGEGWLHTGDLGRVDRGGYLFVDGRMDDLIIRGGENVNPVEIESALCAHPAVEEALVFGVPDPDWGQTVAALVTGPAPVGDDELRSWVRSRLAGFKAPQRIAWVGELPRNDMGKPVRSRARTLLCPTHEERREHG